MGEVSAIAWTDATFNPWWGCTRVSPGCENCYAERLATVRRKLPVWGVDAERKPMSADYWKQPVKWNRSAAAARTRKRVFCASMADVFEELPARNVAAVAVVAAARARLWELIERTPHLDWLLLTKRPQNVEQLVPWGRAWPHNVWLGTTAEDERRAAERLPHLIDIPAIVRFVSHEPALETVDFRPWIHRLDWIITGGESGPHARPYAIEWAERVLRQCQRYGVTPFVKQLGANVVTTETAPDVGAWPGDRDFYRLPSNVTGQWRILLDDKKGGDPSEWPEHLRVQEFPR